jgi:hypothetical protein
MKKTWPRDNKPASFDDLTSPIISAMRYAYKFERKNMGKDIPYSGLEHNQTHYCFSIKESFKADNLKYDEEEQGRDALTIIISAAVQLGIEQGIRIKSEKDDLKKILLKGLLDTKVTEEEIAQLEYLLFD